MFSWRMLVCFQDLDFRQAVGGEGDGCSGIVASGIVSVAMEEVQLNRLFFIHSPVPSVCHNGFLCISR